MSMSRDPGTRLRRSPAFAIAVMTVSVLAVSVGCAQTTDVEKAQKKVDSATKALTSAQATYDSSRKEFCTDAKGYVAALDRYSRLFTDEAATVGDVQELGADLTRPQQNAAESAEAAVDAHNDVVAAQDALTKAQADLAAAQAGTPTSEPPSTTSTTTTLLPAATVDRVTAAQASLSSVIANVSASTPLVSAGQQVNASAFALQIAWLRVLAEAGCLTDQQEVEAQAAVVGFTAALQTALQMLGMYSGEVDGIYGTETVTAVAAFQTANGLPATGYVDRSTAAALQAAIAAKGGAAALQAVATTSAVQTTLKLAGYWTGAVDGQWTQALTDALKQFQTALGVAATGMVDNATMEALRNAIANAEADRSTTTVVNPTTSLPAAPTTEPPTTGG